MTGVAKPYAEVIGDPIAHSKSPLIHGHWLDECSIAAEYRAHHVIASDLARYFAERCEDEAWRGCNITIPHKVAALGSVTNEAEIRAGVGAINTVIRDEHRKLIGTNTDIGGFYAPIADRDWTGASAVVIGAGGAARAVLFALAQLKFGEVIVLNRSPLKAMGLLSAFRLKGRALPLETPLPDADLIVNASPLGMTGQPEFAPDFAAVSENATVYDLVYTPIETPLLATARQAGLETVDGLAMLIAQAALAFELFFGVSPPSDDAVLRRLLLA
ncbi:MAG: shikimate dehydrogenase [Parasphingorhabdus sp.]|nr:shikimate dehydrogenase [Parasphingorhabdus sp.]